MIKDISKEILDAFSHMIRVYQELGRIETHYEDNEISYVHPEFGEILRVDRKTLIPIE